MEELAGLLCEEALLATSSGREDWVWIESVQAETGAAADMDELLAQQSFLGELLRQGRELLDDSAGLEAFAAETAAELLVVLGRRLEEDWLRGREAELLRRAETKIIDALADSGGGGGL